MDEQVLRNRIIQMADSAGLLVVDEDEHRLVSEDTCWVDARVRCQYGQPEGQFILRPTMFCRPITDRGHGCVTYPDDINDLEMIAGTRAGAVREHFDDHKVTVVSELQARAEELSDTSDTVEAMVLHLAADLLEDERMDRNILLEDDLPAEEQ